MEIDKLNSALRNDAISFGLCQQWQGDWKNDWNKEKMVDKFFEGMDFCLKYRYPTNQFIKDNFDLEFRRKSNVLVDDKYSLLNPARALVCGNSTSTMRFNARNQGLIYVRDSSDIKILASGNAFVLVHVLDDACVRVEQKDNAKVVIINHSPDSVIIADSDVKVREELDWLKK